MKQSSEIVLRQNDKEALALLKASEHCLETERWLKYCMIFLSFAVCLAAIFNRYLPQMASNVENIYAIQEKASTYLNLISGAIIVAGLPIGFYASRMHTEGTVLRDRYDTYVFGGTLNPAILRPISQSFIAVYSKKTRKSDEEYKNFLFEKGAVINENTAHFEYISKEVRQDYNMYLSLQPFYMTIWLGFCIIIIIIALSFNDAFITTLINILIPSLSAISTICHSWYSYRLQMRQLNNLLTIIDQIQAMSTEKKKQYIADKDNMRLLSDGLFNYRTSSFVIPVFLVKHHQKNIAKSQIEGEGEETTTQQPKNEVKKDETAAKNETTLPTPAKKTTPQKKETSPQKNTPPKKETATPAKKETKPAEKKKEVAATAENGTKPPKGNNPPKKNK